MVKNINCAIRNYTSFFETKRDLVMVDDTFDSFLNLKLTLGTKAGDYKRSYSIW